MQIRIRLAAALLAALPALAPASVFYKFDIVGQTGTSIVSLGNGPSINDAGKVAYVGNFSNGSTVFVAAPVFGQFDIASNFLSPQRTFGDAVRINRHGEVLTWTRDLSVGLYELVVFRSATANDTTAMVRGSSSPSQPYDVLYQYPAFNANQVLEHRIGPGDDDGVCEAGETCVSQVAFTATDASTSPPRSLATVAVTPNAGDPGIQNEVPGYQGQISRPAMADDGRFAIRDAGTASPIRLYNYNLVAAPVQIAGSAQGLRFSA